jgi:hypothetical protein
MKYKYLYNLDMDQIWTNKVLILNKELENKNEKGKDKIYLCMINDQRVNTYNKKINGKKHLLQDLVKKVSSWKVRRLQRISYMGITII